MFTTLQIFAAWCATLFGLSELLHATNDGERLVGAVIAAAGLTFFSLLLFRLRNTRA